MPRGSGYAIAEIIFWMAASAALGVAIGWMLRRWLGFRRLVRERDAALATGRKQRDQLRDELAECRVALAALETRVGALDAEVASAGQELEANRAVADAVRAERDEARLRAGEQQETIAILRGELDAARARSAREEPVAPVRPARDAEVERLVAALDRARQDRARLMAEVEELAVLVTDLEGRLAERGD